MSESQSSTLLQTKFHRPPLVAGLLPRPQLLALLDQGETCTLTLVVAPPGAGKTSLVCQWLEMRAAPAAWLQLDANDGDPAVFFTYIAHAVRRSVPEFGSETLILLQSVRLPPLAVVVNTLSNEFDQLRLETPFWLILDDYHLVHNPEIDQALASLLLRPPRGFHLLVMSRQTPAWPLGRLRVENRLREVGAADLRFTHAETRCICDCMRSQPKAPAWRCTSKADGRVGHRSAIGRAGAAAEHRCTKLAWPLQRVRGQ